MTEILRIKVREIRRYIELDKPQGRAFVAKWKGRDDRPKSPPPRDRNKRGDSPRYTKPKHLLAFVRIDLSSAATLAERTGIETALNARSPRTLKANR
eukprot:5936509-Pleurochrysis_carterae.AAC.1